MESGFRPLFPHAPDRALRHAVQHGLQGCCLRVAASLSGFAWRLNSTTISLVSTSRVAPHFFLFKSFAKGILISLSRGCGMRNPTWCFRPREISEWRTRLLGCKEMRKYANTEMRKYFNIFTLRM